jgi:hypothetical protein
MAVALISLIPSQTVVAVYGSAPPMLPLLDGRQVYSAQVGWVSQDGKYSLVNVVPFVVPEGQQVSGPATYAVSAGIVTQTFPTQAIPPAQLATTQYQAAIQTGATLTWTVSTTLNATYTIDSTSLILLLVEAASLLAFATFTNGTTSTQWADTTGTLHTVTVAQFKALFLAIFKYIRSLQLTQIQQAAGGNPTWPSASISVTG